MIDLTSDDRNGRSNSAYPANNNHVIAFNDSKRQRLLPNTVTNMPAQRIHIPQHPAIRPFPGQSALNSQRVVLS